MSLKKLAEENFRAELGVTEEDKEMERLGWVDIFLVAVIVTAIIIVVAEWII